jgi:ABC-2 type transport system ATP-binding protein
LTPLPSVHATGLGKCFGDAWVLRDVDLSVPAGTVLGLLGPNGAGKTTTVKILTTLLRPSAGQATVAGADVVADPQLVRRRIGLAGQHATVDELLTGYANLEMIGRLNHLGRGVARARAEELLARFDLVDARDKLVKDYSGGMRRRLDLAASLVSTPPVLFLDEPTTGLDPRSRNALWALLRELVREGTTLLLTTQYLEEADQLADDIVVLDHGRVIAHGTPAALKARVGGERLEVAVRDAGALGDAAAAVAPFALDEPVVDAEAAHVVAPVRAGAPLIEVVRALDAAGVDAADVRIREATLDDVFLSLTGHATAEAALEVAA